MRNDWTMQQGQEEGSAGQPVGSGGEAPAHEPITHGGKLAEPPLSWKVEVVVDDSGEWESDPFRFETRGEALAYARDLDLRWAAVRDRRVVESADPVNQRRPRAHGGHRD
jgi:hypothetical protein